MSFTLDPATAISDPHGISWGMHPITWRNDDIPEVGAFNTLEDMLLDLADTGYAGTECAGFFPPREEVRAAAEARSAERVRGRPSNLPGIVARPAWSAAWSGWPNRLATRASPHWSSASGTLMSPQAPESAKEVSTISVAVSHDSN